MSTFWVRGLRAAVLMGSAVCIAGCKPSATVTRATPVADLQTYRTVLVRAAGAPQLPANAFSYLEQGAAHYIRERCRFDNVQVSSAGEQSASSDLIIDLNVRTLSRGGTGLVQVSTKAVADVALVLSDGINDDLLGSADIRGDSGGMLVNSQVPEDQALDVVAKEVGEIMSRSGCGLPRVARAAEPQKDPGNTDPNNTDPANPSEDPQAREKAEAINDEGKNFFRSADPAAAAQKFQEAINVIPDPKYYFNLCLAHEAMKQYDAALGACNKVMNSSDERLVQKAKDRVAIINDKK